MMIELLPSATNLQSVCGSIGNRFLCIYVLGESKAKILAFMKVILTDFNIASICVLAIIFFEGYFLIFPAFIWS